MWLNWKITLHLHERFVTVQITAFFKVQWLPIKIKYVQKHQMFSFWEWTDTLNGRESTQPTPALLKSCKLANAEDLKQSEVKNAAGQCSEGYTMNL